MAYGKVTQPQNRYFAYPGDNFQFVQQTQPEGTVELPNERPTDFSRCVRNEDGMGKWVEPSWLELKCMKLKGFYYYRLPFFRSKLRILSPVILSLLVVTVPGIFVYFNSHEQWPNYWMAIMTSFLVSWGFYFINVSYPRKKQIHFEAFRVYTLLRRLVELKDAQYRILGLRNDDWTRNPILEDCMNGSKARVLIELMQHHQPDKDTGRHFQCLREFARLPNTHILKGHFDASHQLLLNIFEQLKEVVKPELFPKFYRALVRMDEQLKYHKDPYLLNLTDRPEDYEEYHFRIIEYLECLYNMECVPYVVHPLSEGRILMKFDARFKKFALFPPSFSWDTRWPKVGDGIWLRFR